MADYYYVRLTIDGQEYFINSGSTTIDEYNPTVSVSPNEDSISIVSTTCAADKMFVSFSFSGQLNPNTPGAYLGTYSLTGSDAGLSFIYLSIYEPFPDISEYFQSAGTITINQWGVVGGFCEGTFNVTWISPSPATSFGSPLTTVGDFRLLRVSDEYF